MSKTDELLSQLNECSKFNPLTEAFDMSTISSRMLKLKDNLLSSVGLHNAALSQDKADMIKQVRGIPLDKSFRIMTYPNIHYEQKYKIDASILIDFILKRISENAQSGGTNFNATETMQEGISFTLKYLTGSTPYRYLSLDQFKEGYQKHAFGSFRKVPMIPKITTLTILAQKNPTVVSYIDNRLLYTQIKNITNFTRKIETDFLKLLNNDPSLKYILNSYMSCIERSIRALMNMYKIIRNTFVELENEYFHIFRQIIRMSNANYGIYGECCIETNNFLKSLNKNIDYLETLNESTEDYSECELVTKTMGIEFISMLQNNMNRAEKVKESIYKYIGLVSKLDCSERFTLPIPMVLTNTFSINVIKKYIDSINELIMLSNEDISDISELVDYTYQALGKESSHDINKLRYDITNDLIKRIETDTTLDNVILQVMELLSLLRYINSNFYDKIIIYVNNKEIDNNLNKCRYFKNIILGSIAIVDSIYFNILESLEYFINIIVNMIN